MKHIIKNIIIGYSIFALSGCGIQKFERSVMESMTTEVKSQSYTKKPSSGRYRFLSQNNE